MTILVLPVYATINVPSELSKATNSTLAELPIFPKSGGRVLSHIEAHNNVPSDKYPLNCSSISISSLGM